MYLGCRCTSGVAIEITGIFLDNDFWTPPVSLPPSLLSILYMGLTGSVLT